MVTIHRAGDAATLTPLFEATPHADGSVSFVMILGKQSWPLDASHGPSAMVAAIEIPSSVGFSRLALAFDPGTTMLSDAFGWHVSTAANGLLTLGGATVDLGRETRPPEVIREQVH